ncbi:MAG: hypothetical protein AMXMBFR33_57770 [Candidatus Xenobia bacterium]
MEIRPTGPVRASAPGESKVVEQLVRDVVEAGAEVTAPRWWLPFWPRRVEPEEVAEQLPEGKLRIQLPGQSPLPLKCQQDLEEAAIFQRLKPAPPGSPAEQLLALEGDGWQFADDQGRKLGPYGAYNALTDPAHGLTGLVAHNHNGAVPLESELKLGELHRFRGTESARLEAEGWEFFDEQGRPQPALSASQIGRDREPWIEAGDPATRRERLDRFAARLEKVDGEVELVRRFERHPGDLQTLLQGMKGDRRRALARLALSEMAPMQDARQAGADVELQGLWLEAAAEKDSGARVALEVHRRLDFAREPAWQAALAGGDGLAVARTLSRDLDKLQAERRTPLCQAILEGLTDVSAARAASTWQTSDPASCLKKLLSEPSIDPARLARESLPRYDAAAQRRAMAPGPLLELHEQLKDVDAYHAVFQLATHNPTDPVQLCGSLVKTLEGRSVDHEDRVVLGNFLLDRLSQSPSHQRAAAVVRSWHGRDPYQAAVIALEQPNASDADLALQGITRWDTASQQRFLGQLKGPLSPSLLALHKQLKDVDAYHALFQLACQSPTDPVQLSRDLVSSLEGRSVDHEDRVVLGNWMLDRLSETSSHQRAASTIRQWQTRDPYQAAVIALQSPTASDQELALQGITRWDTAGQRRFLSQLQGPLAPSLLELHSKLQDVDAYHAVFQLACQNPTDPVKLSRTLVSTLEGRSVDHEDRVVLGNWMLDRLSEAPSHQRAADTIRQWQARDPYQAAVIALQSPTATDHELALQGITRWDTAGQRRFLSQLQGPLTPSLLDLHNKLQDVDAYHAVFQLACQSPTDPVQLCGALVQSLEGRSVDHEDRIVLGNFMLDRLSQAPSHQRAVGIIRQWQTRDPYQAAVIALQSPTASAHELALQGITRWDTAGQRRFLSQLQGPLTPSLLDLHNKLQDVDAYHAVFQLACQGPADPVQFSRELVKTLEGRSVDQEDRVVLGNFMLDRLSHLGPARAVRRWQVRDPYQAASVVLQHPKANDSVIARQAISRWDAAGQRLFMAEQTGPMAGSLLELHKSLKDPDCYHAVFELAAQDPQAATGGERAGALAGLFGSMAGRSVEHEDRVTLGHWVLDQLAGQPDTRPAAEALRFWNVRDPYNAASALCDHPSLSTPQELDALALAAIGTWDVEAQARHLQQLLARPGAPPWLGRVAELHGKLGDSKARGAVWSLAAQGSAGNLQEIADRLGQLNLSWEDGQVLQSLLAEIKAELETRKLVAGFQEKNQAIAVEQDRVLVGGVVIRRKSEPTPEASG